MSKKNAAGVDTHRDSHSIVIVDPVGHVLKQWTIATTVEGYQQAIAAAAEFGEVDWGIEGTGSYGRGLADALLRAGATVLSRSMDSSMYLQVCEHLTNE